MQHIRVNRSAQVPVPPVSAAPLELSQELRQQLRVTRHRAFERLQENAQWTRQLLHGDAHEPSETLETLNGRKATNEELQRQKQLTQQKTDHLQTLQTQQKQTQQQFDEMMAILKALGDADALKEAQQKVEEHKKELLPAKPRKMEIVRL